MTLLPRPWPSWKLRVKPSTIRFSTSVEPKKISGFANWRRWWRETVPGARIEYAPGGGPDLRCYRINFDKIHRMVPSFQPQWTARKGAEELYHAYRAAGLTQEDVDSGRYIRLRQIQRLQKEGKLDGNLHWINCGAGAKSASSPAPLVSRSI